MPTDQFLSIVVPAYNESARIGYTLNETIKYLNSRAIGYQVIVVDDGSSDETSRVVEEFSKRLNPVTLLRNARNRGKGYAVRKGVIRARGQWIGYIDADYKTPIEEIEKILPWLRDGYDVVIGSRGLSRSQVERPQPKYRQIGARLFGRVMHTFIGLYDIVDTQCGFKFFQRSVAQNLFSRQKIDGYMFDVEVLYLAECLSYRIKEVPIRWMNDPDSRLQLVRGNLRNMLDLIRIRRNSIGS